MIGDKPAAGKRSASGVRRGGDHFQDLFVWIAAMELLRPTVRYTQVGVEVNDAGNVDDVVLLTPGEDGGLYGQVKWATKLADPVSESYFFAVKGKGRSILQKLYDSWIKLSGSGGNPTLRLVTNRALDPADPLLGHVDGGTELMTPFARAVSPGSPAYDALGRWGEHVGASREQLLNMLDHLHFQTGRTVNAEVEYARAVMLAAGLDDSDDALTKGLATVRKWVVNGVRTRTTEDVLQAVEDLKLRRIEPSVVLSVQAIDTDPRADAADHVLNWLEHYDGDTARTRIVPTDPAAWEHMAAELDEVAARLEDLGQRSVIVRGAMRQAAFFKIGTALPQTRNFELIYKQGQQTWASTSSKAAIAHASQDIGIGAGCDLAVAVGISTDPTDEVLRFLSDTAMPVGQLLLVAPTTGADDQAIATTGQAVSLAERIRNDVRQALGRYPETQHIHLFLAGPGGLALLLGHRWNRLRPTTVYEHRGIGQGYEPAFTIDM